MLKLLATLLMLQSLTAQSQNKLDTSIANLKKAYSENVKGPYPTKIFFNKSEKLIDIGIGGYEIPLSATIKYKYDGAYTPSEHTLVFWWEIPRDKNKPPNSPQLDKEKSVGILFKTKDACYKIIDIIVEIRNLMPN